MKNIYLFDQTTKLFVGVEVITDSDEVPENSTETKPIDGLYDPIWNGKEWVGKTLEEFIADNPEKPNEPTQQEQLNATVLAQIAQNKADQDKFNAQILLQLAKGGN
jgi:hypothetical protein